jgi:hypothetical protein
MAKAVAPQDEDGEESEMYQKIRGFMTADEIRPMLVKYDKDGDGQPDGGTRKMWPMVLGHSPDPELPEQDREMVLCFQTTGSAAERGWRCLKIELILSAESSAPNAARPVLTPDMVRRQSCVTQVELPEIE